MMLHLNRLLFLMLLGLTYLASPMAFSFQVKDISGKKILIDLEDEKLFEGDTVVTMNKISDGSEGLGSAKVLQVRDNQAVALISEGQFVIGEKVTRQTSLNLPAEAEYAEDEEIYETADQRRARIKNVGRDGIIFRKDMLKVALIGSLTQDKISAKQADDTLPFPVEETVPMTGSSYGIGLAFDYPSRWGVTLRGVILNEKLSVTGTSVDDNVCAGRTSSNCLAKITYISAGGHLRFDYNVGRFTIWAAGGTVFKFPTSRETTSLRQDDIAVANALVASGGFDFAFNNRYFLPLAFEYHYSLNKSDTVPIIDHASFLLGLGFKF